MKSKKIFLLLSVAILLASCINDLGNYVYEEPDVLLPITISGLNDTVAIMGQELHLTPKIENMDDESRYVYLWYAAKAVTAGAAPTRDTLSLERNLSAEIIMEAGDYNLVYEVKDPQRDIYVNKKVKLTVAASNISTGWFVLKDENDVTDFDYISSVDGEIYTDVLSVFGAHQEYLDGPVVFGNQQLSGKAVRMTYQNTRYYHVMQRMDGTSSTLINQRVYHIFSEKGIKVFNADNLYLFKENDEVFYEEGTPISPKSMYFGPLGDLYLLNAEKVHSIYGMSANVGKFGFQKLSTHSPQHSLADGLYAGFYGCVVFDNKSRSFFSTTSSGSTLDKMAQSSNPYLPVLLDMEYDLVKMMQAGGAGLTHPGYSIMKHVTTGEYYLGKMNSMGDTSYPFTPFRPMTPGSKIFNSKVMAVPQVASCIYFGIGNVLSYYLDAADITDNEKVIKTFPADEEIVFIGNLRRDLLTVLTNTPSGWKLYGFPIVGTTPDIEEESKFVYSGKGNGRFVMLR